ncbi:hypothetical protein MIND_00574600 [Mycena indigotica]|uniref:Uncharacterized protein n=1 Tax=Mycena indigotica TaxID=2126181 RepID=A0A8H6SQQ1_9AGAR|nr:uncharacterized protein MIND_00574600 [Mycena indigotica]KAF7303458.1 hypothetical protein MIND_00574600 [Mycena indigotica]
METRAPPPPLLPPPTHQPIHVEYHIPITPKTVLEKLYTYAAGTVLEFPETSATGAIGHLFPIAAYKPTRNVAYSLGEPKGAGNKIPTKLSFKTCQGIKACPYADEAALRVAHTTASREEIARRLQLERQQRDSAASTRGALLQKTRAYFTALKRQGCGAPLQETTLFDVAEHQQEERRAAQEQQLHRGRLTSPTCDGRLLFRRDSNNRAFIMCEHRHRNGNRDHLIDYTAGGGLYDTSYLEALFANDLEACAEFEDDEYVLANTGPSSTCTTVANFSTMKIECLNEHRHADGQLGVTFLRQVDCACKFLLYEPCPEFIDECPWALLVCHGAHRHTIPLVTKTPPHIREMIFSLLRRLDNDIADLTPRRFLRHPATTNFLREIFPHDDAPSLLDLHPSLGNRDHVSAYISQVQREMFPSGTGWAGLVHLKEQQDEFDLSQEAYIRYVEELPESRASTFRIAICMAPESSRLLLNAKFIQSDISFRRIAGFKEFELGGLDADSRTSVVYCRIYVNRQTAAAHHMIFQKIHDIVRLDTGEDLRW